jgi:hypothetical protein
MTFSGQEWIDTSIHITSRLVERSHAPGERFLAYEIPNCMDNHSNELKIQFLFFKWRNESNVKLLEEKN